MTTKAETDERKRRAAEILRRSPGRSNREVAREVGLDPKTISRLRPPPGPLTTSRYGRRYAPGERPRALVASAARINLDDRRMLAQLRRLRQAWQDEAWDYYYEVGEINYTVNFDANLKSKLRLYPACRPDPQSAPIPVDSDKSGIDKALADLCYATLERLRSPQGGQATVIRDTAVNFDVAGECWLHGHEDEDSGEEEWYIRSVNEMVATGEGFGLRRSPSSPVVPVPDTDIVVRMWQRDPRFGDLASCPMRAILAEAEALLLLSREIRATSKSRLSNGILLMPSELSFGSADPTRDLGDGEEEEDPFDAELRESMVTPIQEEGSAAAVVPMIIRGPAEYLKEVRHLVLDRALDPQLDLRIEGRIIRIARGLNMPVEVTTGLMATTFANASQIKQSEYEDHVEPAATLLCDALTAGYFQPALEAAGVDRQVWQDLFVWFDPEALIVHPDQAEQAAEAHRDGVISDEARRRYVGFSEDDAPTDDEMMRRILFHMTRPDPFTSSQLFRATGLAPDLMIAMPPAGIVGLPDTQPQNQPQAAPAPQPEPPARPPSERPPPTLPGEENPPPPPEGGPGQAGKPEQPPSEARAAAGILVERPWEPSIVSSNTTALAVVGNGQRAMPLDWLVSARAPGPTGAGRDNAAEQARWAKLGRRLAAIDSDLRNRIVLALDRAMRAALARAGNRVKSRIQREKLTGAVSRLASTSPIEWLPAACGPSMVAAAGLTDQELVAGAFDSVMAEISNWITAAWSRALAEMEKLTGRITPARRAQLADSQRQNLNQAMAQLGFQMNALLTSKLYNPSPGAPPRGEVDASVTIPVSAVRVALAIAGGGHPRGGARPMAGAADQGAWIDVSGPVTDETGDPVAGVATGPDLMDIADEAGAGSGGYIWDYGNAIRRPFEPHEALDGVEFQNFDDDQLANTEGWPDVEYFMPGDHEGCCCDIVPLMTAPGETAYPPPSDDTASLASDMVAEAVSHEPDVTQAVSDIVTGLGGQMQGLDYRLKSEGSLARKLTSDSIQALVTPEEIAGDVTDVLRYTAIFEPDSYVAGAESTMQALIDQGYTPLKFKDSWEITNPYRGINTVFRNPEGYAFELQFHTADSFALKDTINHTLYEKWRVLAEDDPRRAILSRQMQRNAALLHMPDGALDITSPFDMVRTSFDWSKAEDATDLRNRALDAFNGWVTSTFNLPAAQEELATDMQRARQAYTGSYYKPMNRLLREGRLAAPAGYAEQSAAEEFIPNFDRLFGTSEAVTEVGPSGTVVLRGIGASHPLSYTTPKIGQVISELGWVSTTAEPGIGAEFTDGTGLLEMRVPPGTRLLPGTDFEQELILERGTRWKVVEVKPPPPPPPSGVTQVKWVAVVERVP